MTNDALPAFPTGKIFDAHGIESTRSQDGMLLRDYFASAAMNTMLHSCDWTAVTGTIDDMAAAAYRVADAMLEARQK